MHIGREGSMKPVLNSKSNLRFLSISDKLDSGRRKVRITPPPSEHMGLHSEESRTGEMARVNLRGQSFVPSIQPCCGLTNTWAHQAVHTASPGPVNSPPTVVSLDPNKNLMMWPLLQQTNSNIEWLTRDGCFFLILRSAKGASMQPATASFTW